MYGYVRPLTPNEIYHHGILGQKWGKRNGPPYPLGASDHSASERKAGWKKSLDGKNPKEYNRSNTSSSQNRINNKSDEHKGLTDKQKKAIKVGAALVGAALVTGGAVYLAKSGKLDNLVLKGKNEYEKIVNDVGLIRLKKIKGPHGIKEDLTKINPDWTDKSEISRIGAHRNCIACTSAYELRRRGYDVKAKLNVIVDPITGEFVKGPFNKEKYARAIFRGYKENTTKINVKNFSEVDDFITKNYPNKSRGTINFKRGGRPGHSMSWENIGDKLFIIDPQSNKVINTDTKLFRKQLFSKKDIHITRLDNLEINYKNIDDLIEFYKRR